MHKPRWEKTNKYRYEIWRAPGHKSGAGDGTNERGIPLRITCNQIIRQYQEHIHDILCTLEQRRKGKNENTKKGKKKQNRMKRKDMNKEGKHRKRIEVSMRSGRRPSPEGARLLFPGTISLIFLYGQLMDQHQDDTKRPGGKLNKVIISPSWLDEHFWSFYEHQFGTLARNVSPESRLAP